MGTNESQINHIYGSEDAQGILQRAIDFYGYKVRIHVWGDRALEKCFSFYHRTPVTAKVAKGQETRFIFSPRRFSAFVAPRPPVDRIFGVFPQVKALGLSKTVDHNQIYFNSCWVSLSVL